MTNVSHIYNEKLTNPTKALDNINISFGSEKIIGIIGKSGSGKSTLAQTLNALIIPSLGEISLDDFTINKHMSLANINNLRRQVGLVFQFPEEQFFNPTVREEVSFALKYFKYKSERIHKQVSDALSIVGLDDTYLERNVFAMSSGEKRKVAIASVMVFNPKVLILDEPTVGLDFKSKKHLCQLIRKLKEIHHKTIIIISHDVDMLHTIADDIVVMDDGKIIISGPKDEVFKAGDTLAAIGIEVPQIIEFTGKVFMEKGIVLKHNEDIKELIKDIYRNV